MLRRVLFFVAIACATLSSAQSPPEDSILHLESTLNRCWNAHDLTTASRLIADDFRGTSSSGRPLAKSDLLKAIEHNDEGSTDVADEHVRVSGRTAIYTALITDHDAKNSTSIRTRVTDIWEHRHNHWLLIASQETIVKD